MEEYVDEVHGRYPSRKTHTHTPLSPMLLTFPRYIGPSTVFFNGRFAKTGSGHTQT
jgi:hypothetical protein